MRVENRGNHENAKLLEVTSSLKCYCSTFRTYVTKCRRAPSCIHRMSLTSFRYCNSGITKLCNIVLHGALVMEQHVLTPVKMTSLAKYELGTNVLVMPHHSVTLASCKGIGITFWRYSSVNAVLGVYGPTEGKISFIRPYFSAASTSYLHHIGKKSTLCCSSPGCNIWLENISWTEYRHPNWWQHIVQYSIKLQ